MNIPREYFEPCEAHSPGSQLVRGEWWRFISSDSLELMMNDGFVCGPHLITEPSQSDKAKIESLADDIEMLESDLAHIRNKLDELR